MLEHSGRAETIEIQRPYEVLSRWQPALQIAPGS